MPKFHNNIMTYAYWNVGKRIIEQEQKGNRKAKYGSYLIKRLSQELSDEYGTGFSEIVLKECVCNSRILYCAPIP